MEQPIPLVSEKDVERIALREFGQALFDEAMEILREYGRQDWNRSNGSRVRLAVLKLAGGDLDRLREHTKIAIDDFRDVLAEAEYPRYTREIGFRKIGPALERAVMDDDWKQYREWLEKG